MNASRLTLLAVGVSVLLGGGLVAVYLSTNSALALAQATDSIADVLSGGALYWAIRIARRPPDADHPFGHEGAEPIAALIAAVLTGVLAVEVVHNAIRTIVTDEVVRLSPIIVVAFGVKILGKGAVMLLARSRDEPAARALFVDARNDVALSALAVVGWAFAKTGHPAVDAYLAIPMAAWIGYAGIDLARDNIRLLMGESPGPEREAELLAIANGVDGVAEARRIKARQSPGGVELWVEIAVDPELSVRRAHDIGETVEALLENEEDVDRAVAHVHVD